MCHSLLVEAKLQALSLHENNFQKLKMNINNFFKIKINVSIQQSCL
jgi:hypothetical protein